MAEIKHDGDVPARDGDIGSDSSALTDELLQQTRPPETGSKPGSDNKAAPGKDGSNKDVPPEETETKKQLATGDTLVSSVTGDALSMPDGTRIGFLMEDPSESNLPMEQLQNRLIVQGPDGKPIGVRYAATLTSIPPTDVYRLTDGSQMKVTGGIAMLTMRNGTQVYMDDLGIFAVKRGEKGAVVRQPEVIGQEWEVVKPPERKTI